MTTRHRPSRQRDFLDEIIAERSERNPEFPGLVEAARRRRRRFASRQFTPRKRR
jgi:hypothetical protein